MFYSLLSFSWHCDGNCVLVYSLKETSSKDLSNLAKASFELLKWRVFGVPHLQKAVSIILSSAHDSNWRTRSATLTFLRSFMYRYCSFSGIGVLIHAYARTVTWWWSYYSVAIHCNWSLTILLDVYRVLSQHSRLLLAHCSVIMSPITVHLFRLKLLTSLLHIIRECCIILCFRLPLISCLLGFKILRVFLYSFFSLWCSTTEYLK